MTTFYSPPAYAPPPPRPSRKPWNKRTWIILVVAVGAVGASFGVLGGTTAQPTKTVTKEAKVFVPAVRTQTQTTTATATVTATPTIVKTIATKVKTVRVTYTPPPVSAFGDGTYRVGSEIVPGLYHTDGIPGDSCYWKRLSNLSGDTDAILANDIFKGPASVQVYAGDAAFSTSGGCRWSLVG